ncbi:MAG: YhgE/Pip family protein, partial [Mobilicoccus sp.]|nr:YhgE/Pip family protein [Mobilicoccus sp.]
MSLLPSLSSAELRRFTHSWTARIVLIGIVIVPALYAGLLTWSNRDANTHLNAMPAAIVNQDEMVTIADADGNDQPVMVGRLVAGRLISEDDPQNLSWTLTDEQTAADGLADGSYYAVLTIPEGFSAAAVSTQDPADVRAATMTLQTNDAVSYLAGNIAASIGAATARGVGDQLSAQYLDQVYLGFNQIQENLAEAGDGAGELADGSAQVADGASELSDGTRQLTVGLGELAGGAD